MCSETEADGIVDGSDSVVFTPVYYRAAKVHFCTSCGEEIETRHIYAYLAGVFEGDFWNSKFCCDCDHDRRWLNKHGHGWMVGIIRSDYDACRLELAHP